MTTEATTKAIGEKIGHAMARDARAEGMPPEWTGLDPQDGDLAGAAGIQADTPEWEEMEEAARIAFMAEVARNAP